MNRRSVYRALFAAAILLLAAFLVGTNLSATSGTPYVEFRDQADRPPAERSQLAPPRAGITVVTAHLGAAGDIVALSPDGSVMYHNGTYEGYWDVDPSPEGSQTVVYSATDRRYEDCQPVGREPYCVRQLIERANLSTGETEVLYSRVDPRYHGSEWHDVDRIGDARYVVADMYADEVFVVNVTSGVVEWEWSVQNDFTLESGGPFPGDWAHLNDVDVLPDGRLMVSLRNQDQVVFLDRRRGVVENWTLGADDRHRTLHEQHNPDYIPQSNGGPAVLVAGSENNRIVEYQRTQAGGWNRTWEWRDGRLQWPRDADRLPNGHTLVTDTHGGRVFELDRRGQIVWRLDVPVAYEAERIVPGETNRTGPSATRASLTSRSGSDGPAARQRGLLDRTRDAVESGFPNKVVNGVTSVTPIWMGFFDVFVLGAALVVLLVWAALEFWWSALTLRSPLVRE